MWCLLSPSPESFHGLHAFRFNCLTTLLPTYNVNGKHPIYLLVISYCCCCSKLVDIFRGTLLCLLSPESFYRLHAFCRYYLTTFLPTYDINKKHPIYMLVISCHCCCSKLVGAPHWRILLHSTVIGAKRFYKLYAFRRNCLTTSRATNDVNKKYTIYMLVISYRYYCSKLVGTSRQRIYCL